MPISAHYLKEIKRKSVHLSSLWIPGMYFFLHKEPMVNILLFLTAGIIILDVGRHFSWYLGNLFYTLCGKLLRPHEIESGRIALTGATYMMIASLIVVALFSKVIAFASLSILMVSDSVAALIGKRYGTIPLAGKTLQGTLAFALSGIAIIVMCGKLFPVHMEFYIAGIIAACVGAAVELYSPKLRLDDNFTIPLAIGSTMWALMWLLKNFH